MSALASDAANGLDGNAYRLGDGSAAAEGTALRTRLGVLRRRRGLALGVAGTIALVFVLFAVFLPSVYRATATILIEEPEIPPDMVRSTITSYGDKRIETIYQRVMTGENLLGILRENDLYPRDARSRPREVLLQRMRDDLGMEIVSADVVDTARGSAVKATIAFKVWFEHVDPDKAYRVSNTLTTLFLNENLRNRAELASATTKFLSMESEQLSSRVAELEQALAAFKEGNVQSLPELKQANLQLADRADRDIEENRRLLQSLQERRALLERQLTALEPSLVLFDERGERIASPTDRLHLLRTQLIEARSRYSPNHPDVQRLQEQADALARHGAGVGGDDLQRELDRQREALTTLREKYTDSHPEVKLLQAVVDALASAVQGGELPTQAPTNPAYLQARGELDALEVQIAAAREREVSLHDRFADYTARLAGSPALEREFAALAREYETTRLKYADVRAKQFEAEMSEAMETDRKGERFELIEPPLRPEEAVRPNRVLLLWIGALLAVLAGLGAAFVAEALDPRIDGGEALLRLLGVTPLAVVPYVTIAEERRRARRWWVLWIGLAVLVLLGLVLAVHFLVLPLQTLVFSVLARLGLG